MTQVAMYDVYTVKRTQIYLDSGQDDELARRAEASGRTKSELIREALDQYLRGGSADAELKRFRQALADAAGVAPYLPTGAEYVDEIRPLDGERERELERRWRGGAE